MKKTAPPKTLAQMVYDKRRATPSKTVPRRIQSLTEAAEEIGIGASTLSRVEKGSIPDTQPLLKICAWLGVSVEEAMEHTATNV